ncbi:MAG: HDIG domain-containing protein [Candidatus Nitrotoga sp. SPKER]|nr:MAG: HDIG domain-containing protein [Candidatus Nitrotoga sp. SPKER]
MSEITLQMVVADLDRLPALPEVVQDLMDYLQRPEVDIGQVAYKIARDPALAAKLLRIANSSFYGLQRQVATIRDALTVLGLRAARTLVIGAAVVTHFQALVAVGYDQRAFWLHSAGTALCARALARELGANMENSFTAGLLHDIGRFILVALFPEAHRRVMAYRDEHDCYPIEAEQEILGFNHTQIGAALAVRWKFPAEIAVAIAHHHNPMDIPANSLVDLVHMADVMAHVLEFSGGNEKLVPCLSDAAWDRLGIGWVEFKRLLGEVDAQRDEAGWMLS